MPEWGYAEAAAAVMARAALSQGTIADQGAGDAEAERGLVRMAALLDRLDHPEDAMPLVHVAGSKGKGSTTVMIAAILRAAGRRVGRITSPHLQRLTERTTVDGDDIDDLTFVGLTREVTAACEAIEADVPPRGRFTAYEMLLAISLLAVRRAGCDVAVVEVGLGGRLDASNVIRPAVSVITTLDLEHTAILGPTQADIAREKAGIIKPGRPVTVAPQPAEALAVIRSRAAELRSPIAVIGDGEIAAIPDGATARLPGAHQRLNAAVAVAAIRQLEDAMPGFGVSEAAIRDGLSDAWLPGRFEVVDPVAVSRLRLDGDDPPTVVLDGAHTPRSAAALRVAIEQFAGGVVPIVVLLGMASDKDLDAVLRAVGPTVVVPVAVDSPRAVPVTAIAAAAEAASITVRVSSQEVGPALAETIRVASPDTLIVVTGSFAVVAEARSALAL